MAPDGGARDSHRDRGLARFKRGRRLGQDLLTRGAELKVRLSIARNHLPNVASLCPMRLRGRYRSPVPLCRQPVPDAGSGDRGADLFDLIGRRS